MFYKYYAQTELKCGIPMNASDTLPALLILSSVPMSLIQQSTRQDITKLII
jgi:hypothetical protein